MTILEQLISLSDSKNAEFQSKLTPTLSNMKFLGVRNPQCRELAKTLYKSTDENVKKESQQFLNTLPHSYFDENMLHGFLISEIKDFDLCLSHLEKFLPYIDNWAVCDSLSPKIFKKHKVQLLEKIKVWAESKETFICRFGLGMLMRYFLDEDFDSKYFEIVLNVKSEEYYVKMMIAWYFATALAKQWDSTISIIEKGTLEKWTHNKTIQKAIESFRVSDEHKEYLRTLKKA